jgi:hypothetical protein
MKIKNTDYSIEIDKQSIKLVNWIPFWFGLGAGLVAVVLTKLGIFSGI